MTSPSTARRSPRWCPFSHSGEGAVAPAVRLVVPSRLFNRILAFFIYRSFARAIAAAARAKKSRVTILLPRSLACLTCLLTRRLPTSTPSRIVMSTVSGMDASDDYPTLRAFLKHSDVHFHEEVLPAEDRDNGDVVRASPLCLPAAAAAASPSPRGRWTHWKREHVYWTEPIWRELGLDKRCVGCDGNVDDLMACPDIDGALVGGASLKAESFDRIINFTPK